MLRCSVFHQILHKKRSQGKILIQLISGEKEESKTN